MIRLERAFSPLCLAPSRVADLTAQYLATGTSVWNFDELKEALLRTSFGKCAYCECRLSEESKYVEVEHFFCKGLYAHRVVEWENLVPSCKRCNAAKSAHDVATEPIVNPYIEQPADHLTFRLYQLRPASEKGRATLEVLDLNDFERVVKVRFEIGEAVQASLSQAAEKLERYTEQQTTRRRNVLLSHLRGLLQECQPSSDYSATSATVLHSDERYAELRSSLIRLELWSEELEELHFSSGRLVLRCV
jgi:uncharacterized protein (TIGR02646 family)